MIATELGTADNGRAVTGAELETMSDEELVRTTREVSVYARVNPSHKLRIVKALQSDGETVAMTGDLRHAQTMAFTTMMAFQIFHVFNARSDERSAFEGIFRNHWLWAATALSVGLHVAVIYTPFLQNAFSTVDLTLRDWLMCIAVASLVLWLREVQKLCWDVH